VPFLFLFEHLNDSQILSIPFFREDPFTIFLQYKAVILPPDRTFPSTFFSGFKSVVFSSQPAHPPQASDKKYCSYDSPFFLSGIWIVPMLD